MFAPVEVPGVDDDAADGCTVSADPFGGRVEDDVCTVVDRSAKVATGAESVVDLGNILSEMLSTFCAHPLDNLQ